MKTTINLNDSLLSEAKKRAAERGVTLTALFEEALRDALTKPEPTKPYKLKLKTIKGGDPYPFDISSRAAMYEWLDRHPEPDP